MLAFVLGQVGFQKISKQIQVTFVDKRKQAVKIIGTFCANSGVVALSKKDLAEKMGKLNHRNVQLSLTGFYMQQHPF